MKKGDRLTNITIETMAAEGKCIARIDGKVALIDGGAPGDVVDIELTKIKSNFLEARVAVVHQFSKHRAQPFCEHFGLCGGCVWQHIQYGEQLKYKQQQVIDNLERIGGLQLPPIQTIVASTHTQYYRNKLDYTFTANRWLTKEELNLAIENKTYEVGLGYHIPKMYDRVFDVRQCHLQPDPSNAIRLLVRQVAIEHGIPFFDLRKQIGFLRTLTIRSTLAGELMVILQVTYDKMEWTEKILTAIAEKFPQVTSINY
ncbi:MAG: class I SAM-dependent RNA methyltransferase, partial [Flammeovirgaceae bacterium]